MPNGGDPSGSGGPTAVEHASGEASAEPEAGAALLLLTAGGGDTSMSDRPTDDAILLQHNTIRAEQDQLPYIGDVEPLSELKAEYSSGSPVFLAKIEALEKQYSGMRRTRRDGNCFFRAFIFAYLERLLATSNTEELARFKRCIQDWREKLVSSGFQLVVFEDAQELLLEQVTTVESSDTGLSLPLLESSFRDDLKSNYVVMLLRMITSAEIKRRWEFFEPFVMGSQDEYAASLDAERFCQRFVEAMGEESDHVQMAALTDALVVPCRVMYLDSGGGGGGPGGAAVTINSHDFVPELLAGTQQQQEQQPLVHVLYRPGHYDILYPTSS